MDNGNPEFVIAQAIFILIYLFIGIGIGYLIWG